MIKFKNHIVIHFLVIIYFISGHVCYLRASVCGYVCMSAQHLVSVRCQIPWRRPWCGHQCWELNSTLLEHALSCWATCKAPKFSFKISITIFNYYICNILKFLSCQLEVNYFSPVDNQLSQKFYWIICIFLIRKYHSYKNIQRFTHYLQHSRSS